MNALQLTREFIKIPSLTPEEGEFAEYVEGVFEQLNWHIRRQHISDDRWNLFVTPNENVDPVVVYCAHLDTVAPHIELSEDDEFIYGRGACDDKGVMAAQIEAATKLVDEGRDQIGLLFTVGEEVDSVGAKEANEMAPDSVRYTIIGEPTENVLVVGQKGIYIAEIMTSGKAAHSAYPELGDSAVEKLLNILERLRKTALPSDDELGDTTLNISMLSGGDRYNVIPDSAGASVMFRVSTSTEEIDSLLRDAVGDSGEIKLINKSEPQRLVPVPGFEQRIVAFGSDVPYLTNWGERLMIGPGSIHDAHTDHERIRKTDLQDAVQIYIDIGKNLLSR